MRFRDDDDLVTSPDAGGPKMDEGMRWLARQLAWDDALTEYRHDFAKEPRTPVSFQAPDVEIKAPTAGVIVDRNRIEAA
jgi:hypothetical protein